MFLTGKKFGTDQTCSLKRSVRLTRVFVGRGSTVFWERKVVNGIPVRTVITV